MKQYEFPHASDPSIKYAYRRATTDEFATYWNANVAAGGNPDIVAQSNLAIAVRTSPDKDTFAELLDSEWSSLPANIIGILLGDAGLFPLASKVDEDHGERLDMVALSVAEKRIINADGIEVPQDAHGAMHMARMRQLGMNDTMFGQWFGKRNPAITRIVLAFPESIGGYYVGRVPSLNDRHNAQLIQRAPTSDDEHGAFDALCKLFLDCCLWCSPLTPSQMIEQWPGAVVATAMLVRDLGTDSFRLEQAKSNP